MESLSTKIMFSSLKRVECFEFDKKKFETTHTKSIPFKKGMLNISNLRKKKQHILNTNKRKIFILSRLKKF